MSGRRALFDPFSGIAGDMILGCWMDLGLDRDWLGAVVDALRVDAELRAERVVRAGLSATKVTVVPARAAEGGQGTGTVAPSSGRAGGAGAATHGGRHFREIRQQIEESGLDERSKKLALAAFTRLAVAEGRVHGLEPERVHFHEVGAVDALVDICGAADGFVRLGILDAATYPVAVGKGSIPMAHGTYPGPAPATAYLLEGIAVRFTGYDYECVTPTGAALLAELTGGRPAAGDAIVERIGYGAGDRDPEDHPNCLRVWLLAAGGDARDTVLVLQTDVDDLTPEYIPDLVQRCLEAGALDAVVLGVSGKRGRPGWRLEVLVEPSRRDVVEEAVFRHSTTLGVRSWGVQRRTLVRSTEIRQWREHRIRVKLREVPGVDERRGKAEYADVAAAAAAEGLEAPQLLRLLRQEWPDLD